MTGVGIEYCWCGCMVLPLTAGYHLGKRLFTRAAKWQMCGKEGVVCGSGVGTARYSRTGVGICGITPL